MCCCVVLEGLSDLFDVLERLVGFYLLSYARRRQNRPKEPVAVVGFVLLLVAVCLLPAAPAVRVRLKFMAAQTSEALLAQNFPDGRCASGPPLRSAMTCSTISWARWVFSACSTGKGELVNTAWCR